MAKKMNLPNTLSLLRVILTPIFMLSALLIFKHSVPRANFVCFCRNLPKNKKLPI